MTIEHELKITEQYYEDIKVNGKEFEIRKDDRNYKEGDKLFFREVDKNGEYTGNVFFAEVGYILRGFVGLQEGYCSFVLVNAYFPR